MLGGLKWTNKDSPPFLPLVYRRAMLLGQSRRDSGIPKSAM